MLICDRSVDDNWEVTHFEQITVSPESCTHKQEECISCSKKGQNKGVLRVITSNLSTVFDEMYFCEGCGSRIRRQDLSQGSSAHKNTVLVENLNKKNDYFDAKYIA